MNGVNICKNHRSPILNRNRRKNTCWGYGTSGVFAGQTLDQLACSLILLWEVFTLWKSARSLLPGVCGNVRLSCDQNDDVKWHSENRIGGGWAVMKKIEFSGKNRIALFWARPLKSSPAGGGGSSSASDLKKLSRLDRIHFSQGIHPYG